MLNARIPYENYVQTYQNERADSVTPQPTPKLHFFRFPNNQNQHTHLDDGGSLGNRNDENRYGYDD
jgi:hypothetical protein